ncbi:o-methyltransferas-like protein [Cadophora sp. DSE1049]|nr:o-methyltransferas-like protein [Cadophora sp. DSE1049]
MEDIISQIQLLANKTDDLGRKKIQNSLQSLQYSLETESDMAMRLSGLPLQITCARIGADLKLFSILSVNETPITIGKLAEKTGAAEELLGRILRYLASLSMISETGENEFAANETTRRLAQPSWHGAIHHSFDTITPVLHTLPSFLASTNYRTISSPTSTPFQTAFSTPLSCFEWLPSQPERFGHFQHSMSIPRGNSDWLSVFPFEEEIAGWRSEMREVREGEEGENKRVVFVDVGGGRGGQCVELRRRFPKMSGRVVLQDLSEAIKGVELEGVEVEVGDFWGVQSAKGAKFYYLRAILHDYPDEKCVEILKNIVPAMRKDSRILIDEIVLPKVGVSTEAMEMDLMMMACFGALERTQGQWENLVERAGMRIVERYVYNAMLYNTVLVLAL